MDSLDSMFAQSYNPYPPIPPPSSIPSASFHFKWIILGLLILAIVFFLQKKKEVEKSKEKERPREAKEVKEVKEIPKEADPKKEPKRGIREAGIAVRDALLDFAVEPEQIAAIVRYSVTVLSDVRPKAPKETPQETPKETPKESPSKTHFSVKGLDLPVDDDDVAAEPGGEKQGKINADTNPLVLQMVKDRKN